MKITNLLLMIAIALLLYSCAGVKPPKPLSEADRQKITESFYFEDTDKDGGEISGRFVFTPPKTVKFPKEIKTFVFVLSTNTSLSGNVNCSDGQSLATSPNPIEGTDFSGSIKQNTEFIEGMHILLCFRNEALTKVPTTYFSGAYSEAIVDLDEPEVAKTDELESDEAETTDVGSMTSEEFAPLTQDAIYDLAQIDALYFEDTDPDESQIGGLFEFDPLDIVLSNGVDYLIFVHTNDEVNNADCSNGTEIGRDVPNAGLFEGYIDQNTAFQSGDHILLCFQRGEYDSKEVIYSRYSISVLDYIEEEPVMTNSKDNVVIQKPSFEWVYFDYNKYNVKSEYANEIESTITNNIASKTSVDIVVEGHADERGSDEYNMALSERRANAAKRILIKNGIPVSNIKVVPYGEQAPVSYGKSERDYAKNRRAVIVVK